MHHFFAYVSRLRYIRRWGLMRSVMPENDAEHSLQVAMIAHAIAVMGRDRYGRDCNPEHILALGVYHDVSEVITGDMPTPVKYHSRELRSAYKDVEAMANGRLLTMLPEGMQSAFAPYLSEGKDYDHRIVKAADSISAYLKCMEEKRAGNHEFDAAGEVIRAGLMEIELPEVQDFITTFVPSFNLSLDELNQPGGTQA
ncbi:MAG: 5'-deoxynucleotidase [Clostridia bacterium]|nr:5'-deoxynucleotidase [Clostridia bacterium]